MPTSPIAHRLISLHDMVQTLDTLPSTATIIGLAAIMDGLIEVCGSLEAEIEQHNKSIYRLANPNP